MAVNNTLVKAKANNKAVTFMAGEEQINLTPDMVKKYLVSGDASSVTDQEIVMFMMMCKGNHLNPWNKEAYCIKYGTQPATMVVGKEAYMKRANAHPQYDGMDDGIVVLVTETGEMIYRKERLRLKVNRLSVDGLRCTARTDPEAQEWKFHSLNMLEERKMEALTGNGRVSLQR